MMNLITMHFPKNLILFFFILRFFIIIASQKSINLNLDTILTSSLYSCASIFSGTNQTIKTNSEPSKANFKVNGIEKGRTPLIIKLRKGNDSQLKSIDKKDYKTMDFTQETDFNTIAILNLFNIREEETPR